MGLFKGATVQKFNVPESQDCSPTIDGCCLVWQTLGRDEAPNGDRADLGTKLEDYVLNPLHREGRHKARVLDSALGITMANSDVLHQAIISAAENSDDAEPLGNNGHGEIYILRFPLKTQKGSATVFTAWIVRNGEDFPRLITCYIV